MLWVVITERSGAQQRVSFHTRDISIGRLDSNDLVLERENVSKRHCRILSKDGRCVVVDLGSTNGTHVNGRRISGPMVVQRGDKIYIGDYILTLETVAEAAAVERETGHVTSAGRRTARGAAAAGEGALPELAEPGGGTRTLDRPASRDEPDASPRPAASPPAHADEGDQTDVSMLFDTETTRWSEGGEDATAPPEPGSDAGDTAVASPTRIMSDARMQRAVRSVMKVLASHLDIHAPHERVAGKRDQALVDATIGDLLRAGRIADDLDPAALSMHVLREALGLGPLERLLEDSDVREIVLDGPERLHVDRGEGLVPAPAPLSGQQAVWTLTRRLWARGGRPLQEHPAVQEIQLDEHQVRALLPPLAPGGPLLAIKRRSTCTPSPNDLIADGVLSEPMLDALEDALTQRHNLLVVGPASSGVSTLLAALVGLADANERIASVEPHPSLPLPRHVVRLRHCRARMGLRELFEHITWMRFDRVVIDDLDPADASELVDLTFHPRGLLIGAHDTCAGDATECDAGTNCEALSWELPGPLAGGLQMVLQVSRDPHGTCRVMRMLAPDATGRLRPLYLYRAGRFEAGPDPASPARDKA